MLDLSNSVYGEWYVSSEAPRRGHQRYWYATCSCGTAAEVDQASLRAGRSTKCRECANKQLGETSYAGRAIQADKCTTLYALRCGDYVKIGVTSNLDRRLAALQVGNPYPITVVFTTDNEQGLEEFYHTLYAERHTRGEWFHFPEED